MLLMAMMVMLQDTSDNYDYHGDCNYENDGYDIFFIYFNISSLCTLPSAPKCLYVKKNKFKMLCY